MAEEKNSLPYTDYDLMKELDRHDDGRYALYEEAEMVKKEGILWNECFDDFILERGVALDYLKKNPPFIRIMNTNQYLQKGKIYYNPQTPEYLLFQIEILTKQQVVNEPEEDIYIPEGNYTCVYSQKDEMFISKYMVNY